MNRIRKRLTYANVMSSIAVFLVLGGAAFAATKLPKNSVGSKQLKSNAVTAAKIKKNAVTAAKIAAGAVDGSKVKDGSLTGSDINLGSLGTVPSANSANSANTAGTTASLAGHTPFLVRLSFGHSQTLASNGAVSLVAECIREESGTDRVRILEQTSVNGAVAGGSDDWNGGSEPTDFLNPNTEPDERELVYNTASKGETDVESYIDQGFVLGPEGKGLTTNSEGIALGLNYAGSDCILTGVIDAVG